MDDKKKQTKKKNKKVNKENSQKEKINQKQKDVEAIFKTSPSTDIKDKKTKKENKELLQEIEKTVKINVDKIVSEQAKIKAEEKEKNIIEKEKYKGIIYITFGFIVICLLLMIYTINNTNVKVKSLEEAIEKRITKVENVSPMTIFYGDSITDYYALDRFFNNDSYLNKGISGITSSDALKELKENVLNYHPKRVLLLIGTNDLNADIKNDKTISNIEEMIIRIQNNNEKTKIFVELILPINNSDNDKIDHEVVGKRTNKKIKAINKQIENICNKYKVTYIDTYSKMTDKDGLLNLDYTKEGLHLNDDGYQKLTSILNEYLKTDN